jgi:hypothetical protein
MALSIVRTATSVKGLFSAQAVSSKSRAARRWRDRPLITPSRYGVRPSPQRPQRTIDSQQIRYIKLDYVNARSFALMKQFATDMHHAYRKHPDVQGFFIAPKTYFTRAEAASAVN